MLQQIHSFLGTVPEEMVFSLLLPFFLIVFAFNRIVNVTVSLNKKNAWLCGLGVITGMALVFIYKAEANGFTPGMTVGLVLTFASSFLIGGLISKYKETRQKKT